MVKTIFDFEVKDLDNNLISLKKYEGKTMLIVNVASKCGFTSQYAELEQIYKEYHKKGLEILAFPCNQFGEQEPGSAAEIKQFCTLKYDVSFPIFSKIEVNGDQASPLYTFLKESIPGILGTKSIKWNFTKFLIDKTGKPVGRFAPKDKPLELLNEIKKYL